MKLKARTDGFYFEFSYKGDSETANLPIKLRREVGLTSKQEDKLIDMNDSGKSFVEIAKYISKKL